MLYASKFITYKEVKLVLNEIALRKDRYESVSVMSLMVGSSLGVPLVYVSSHFKQGI